MTTHHEVYGGRDEDVRDVEWLELCADRSLVVLSKDRRLRYRPDEIAVIRRRRLRVFVLSRGNLTSSAQVGRFVGNAARIEAEIARRGPFVCVVYAAGVVRVFP